MKPLNILVLSHTGAFSHFKIGSHHYASKLSDKGNNVYYSGVPQSYLHKLLRRKVSGSYKLNNKVSLFNFPAIFPITLRNYVVNTLINKLYCSLAFKSKIDFDLVICDYPFFLPFLNQISYQCLVYRPTDDYVSMAGNKVSYYERKIIHLASKIICTSSIVKDCIISRYTPKDLSQIYVVENGYDSDLFCLKKTHARKNCIYVGSLDERFSFDDLYFFAKKFPNVIFDIYGPLSEQAVKFRDVNLLNNINFKGAIDYSQVPDVMNQYRIGLLPLTNIDSNKGRSPMKLWEYYSCGLNVVYSNISHIKSKLFYGYDSESRENMIEVFQYALMNSRDYSTFDNCLLENSWDFKVEHLIRICRE